MAVIPKIVWPVPSNSKGSEFGNVDEILAHLDGESTGTWLIGRNGMWHGGIHITDTTTPWCALSGKAASELVDFHVGYKGEQAIRCMADGEVVAYRICKDYLTIDWEKGPLSCAGSFLLVRHYIQPGETEKSGLHFYTLYMHLAPYSAYESQTKSQWTVKDNLSAYAELDWLIMDLTGSAQKPGKEGVVKSGTHITWDEQDPKLTAVRDKRKYGLVTLNENCGTLRAGDRVWMLVDNNNIQPVTGNRPSWWLPLSPPASEAMQFNKVVSVSEPYAIKAGDPVGHMGYFQAAKDGGYEARYQVHIECISTDENLANFLTNPEKAGKNTPQYLKYASGMALYQKYSRAGAIAFEHEDGRNTKGKGVLTLSKVPVEPKDVKEGEAQYYQLRPEGGYVLKSDGSPELLSQYDLDKLGFTLTENAPSSFDYLDGKTSPKGLVQTIFEFLYRAATEDTRISHALVSHNYQRLLGKIERGVTPYSPQEYLRAVHNPSYRDVVQRMIVKHPSDWYHKKGDSIWQQFLSPLKTEAPEWKKYSEAFLDKITWMQDVTTEKLGPKLWHLHPVMFLGTLIQNKSKQIIFPLKVKPKNDKNGVWSSYYWAAALADRDASQAIFGRNRNGGARKHAARDLYTEPLTEIVAICNGVVSDTSIYYYGTWQITVKHETTDGRHFFIRYGEVDPGSILVKAGDKVKQGDVIAKTGLLINPATGRHPNIIPGKIVYMLHFEYYPGNNSVAPPNNTGGTIPPYDRRDDLKDPLEILEEGYKNTFENESENSNDRIDVALLNISEQGKSFIKGWEGFESKAYNDSEGYCTIGYGHLISKSKCEDITLPEEFKAGITRERADELFESRLPSYVNGVKDSVTVKLYQYEFDALVSLLFGLGGNGLKVKAPILREKLNNEDYEGAAQEFLDITNGGQSGLVKRRMAEKNMFSNNVYDSSH